MKRPYLVLTALLFLFAAPGIVAYLVYTHPSWLQASTNRGHLLQPAPRLQSMGQHKKWQLLLWSPAGCDAECARRMNDLARIRLSLGRRLYHVDIILAMPMTAPKISIALQQQLRHDDARLLRMDAEDEATLGLTTAIYIVNPAHDVILAYTPTQVEDDIFHDLKIVVKD